MPDILELRNPHGWPGRGGCTAPPSDDAPLPAELDTQVLERNAQLQRLNEELEAFSYSVCHDLTGPLLQIQAYLELLKSHPGAQLDDTAQSYLAISQGCADRMSRLTQALLRLSGISRTQALCHRIELSQMARDIASSLAARAPVRRVEWLITTGLEAEGDPGLIEILLTNLFSNAWKYTANCTLARIEFGALSQSQGPVVYYVRDNGSGFDMGSVGRLFQPFERLHPQSEFPGSGIGLATARRIIQRHGGRIWAEGSAGQGAIFRFTLGPQNKLAN